MSSGQFLEISIENFKSLQLKAIGMGLTQSYLPESHQLEYSTDKEWLVKVSLPWSMTIDESGKVFKKEDYHLALVMIRAGIAATGYFHNGELIDHKVIRAYMVRQKQGKSQIKYLKTKGKSRAGSRVRLGESEMFFKEINDRLKKYAANYPIDTWGISCSKTLWPFFFGATNPPPFDKKQENLLSIPFHVQHPDFETLLQIHRKLESFHLLLSDLGKSKLGSFEESINSPSGNESEDDW
ncbi:hypothetical protein [Algoriphagus sp.]|uniref:hypothetical protein n=1 Tax=Algoriphagus sp. TaxID=1872435 RepID=UPI0025EFBB0C|nr:hypothetical protein [Algoriphagus sp.]